jgi:hypothetical protein
VSLKWGQPRSIPPRLYTLMLDAWGLMIGVSCILTAILAIVLPESVTQQTSAAQELGEVLEDTFTLLYGVSGTLIVYGLLTRNYAADALGLCVLSSALLIRIVTAIAVSGFAGLYGVPTLFALMLAALARAAVVSRLVEPSTKGLMQ